MKRVAFYLCVFFIIIVMVSFLPAQIGLHAQPVRKSIHQLEWEFYQKIPRLQAARPDVGPVIPLQLRRNPPTREVFGYLPYWVYESYSNLNYNLLTTIAYFGADVDGYGNIVNLHDWPAASLIRMAHQHGVRVVLTAILFSSDQLHTLLSDSTHRANLITNLLQQVQRAGADGVTIDFEGVPAGEKQNLTDFMTELSFRFHTEIPGSFVTIFTPAVDWNNVFDYYTLAQVCDGLIMQGYDYHWSSGPTAGPVAPLTGNRWGFANVTWTVNDYLSKTSHNNGKLILSVPFYGLEWPTRSDQLEAATTGVATALRYPTAYANAQNYGYLWDSESQTPWYKYQENSQWHQGWFDDSTSLALKFNLVNDKDLKGIAIWALSYDGSRTELQGAISQAFGSTAPPLKPTRLRIVNIGSGVVRIAMQPSAGATSYRIYWGSKPKNLNRQLDAPGATVELSGLSADSVYYFRVAAVNGNGESNLTEMLAVRPSSTQVKILLVNGFDRTSGTYNTFDFVKRFAPSIARAGYAFDSCANEAIEEGDVSLLDYEVVIWISGEEGTADESFSATEQQKVAQYLENGGKLFVSGSEIGYDLVEKGSSADQQFYTTYLKAQYVRDRVATYTIAPTSSGIFTGLGQMHFDNGTHGTYDVDYPDGIKPANGAQFCMKYPGFSTFTYGGAGIQYAGLFGNGTTPGKLVYLAIPFETIYPASARDSVMFRVLRFFDLPTGIRVVSPAPVVSQFSLGANYPNPFNSATRIPFSFQGQGKQQVSLEVLSVNGQLVKLLWNGSLLPGKYEFTWDGRNEQGLPVASGIYFYRLQVGQKVKVRQMLLQR